MSDRLKNVVFLRPQDQNYMDTPVDDVIQGAVDVGLQDIVIIGWDHEGGFYFASSASHGPDVNWMLDIAKSKLIQIGEKE